jgi:hypothetical protein
MDHNITWQTADEENCDLYLLEGAIKLLGTGDLKVSFPAEEHDDFDMDRIHTPEGEGGKLYLGKLDNLTIATTNNHGCQIVFARTQDIT